MTKAINIAAVVRELVVKWGIGSEITYQKVQNSKIVVSISCFKTYIPC